MIQTACGEAPDLTKVCDSIPAESVFLFTPEDLEAFERLRRENPEEILRVADYHPERIGRITDSSNRAGCYIRKAR